MDICINYHPPSTLLPYKQIREAYSRYEFNEDLHEGEGKTERRFSNTRYAEVKIVIERVQNCYLTFGWDVNEKQIPSEYFDMVFSTVKAICSDHPEKDNLKIKVVHGAYHEVDSSLFSFEIATFKAIADLVGYDIPSEYIPLIR
ncbi:hypothetical protein DBR40_13175 [Pedobacter sp. KBW01]|uniref:hypothetical protein n=1 Tax=Pedobacter sp. KBW01 TaxID=2153364 RepID=UPI000F5B390D|nr:hypothetical protein [Pedobacter sp. KBW01]RQO73756.1 hypothetical protein DBR40_13175 [Pedobacter sp. KBW01]